MESVLEFTTSLILRAIESSGYVGIFLLMAVESANVPVPSEIVMPFSGFLVSTGAFSFWLVVLAGAFGNLAGSVFSYWLGYLVRKNVLHWNNARVEHEVHRAQAWTRRFGYWAAFVSRLLPVVRTFISFPLGVIGGISLWRFSVLTFFGSFMWSWFLAWVGFIFGERWNILAPYFRQFDILIVAGVFIAATWYIWRHWVRSRAISYKL